MVAHCEHKVQALPQHVLVTGGCENLAQNLTESKICQLCLELISFWATSCMNTINSTLFTSGIALSLNIFNRRRLLFGRPFRELLGYFLLRWKRQRLHGNLGFLLPPSTTQSARTRRFSTSYWTVRMTSHTFVLLRILNISMTEVEDDGRVTSDASPFLTSNNYSKFTLTVLMH